MLFRLVTYSGARKSRPKCWPARCFRARPTGGRALKRAGVKAGGRARANKRALAASLSLRVTQCSSSSHLEFASGLSLALACVDDKFLIRSRRRQVPTVNSDNSDNINNNSSGGDSNFASTSWTLCRRLLSSGRCDFPLPAYQFSSAQMISPAQFSGYSGTVVVVVPNAGRAARVARAASTTGAAGCCCRWMQCRAPHADNPLFIYNTRANGL